MYLSFFRGVRKQAVVTRVAVTEIPLSINVAADELTGSIGQAESIGVIGADEFMIFSADLSHLFQVLGRSDLMADIVQQTPYYNLSMMPFQFGDPCGLAHVLLLGYSLPEIRLLAVRLE